MERKLEQSLSGRERELLLLAAQGLTDHGISHTLGISIGTVGTYWGRVRIKFGPMSRTELVAVYLKEQSLDALQELTGRVSDLVSEVQQHIKLEGLAVRSRDHFRGLLETAPDAIVVVFSDGTIQLANKQAELMFGYEQGQLLGIGAEELIPERYRAQHVLSRKQHSDDPIQRRVGEHLSTFAIRKDKSEFPMAMAISSSETAEGVLVTCIIRDLTTHLKSKRMQ